MLDKNSLLSIKKVIDDKRQMLELNKSRGPEKYNECIYKNKAYDEILELASLIQGDQYQGKVPMTIKCDDEIKQCVVLGFIIYGKAIHDYSKIIYFVNKSI